MEREKLINERLEAYIDYESWILPKYLEKLYIEAVRTNVPVIRKPVQTFLKTLLEIHKPKDILEIGTAVGFSALLISEYTLDEAKIVTIEKVPDRIKKAKYNFEKYDKKGKIQLLEGDVLHLTQDFKSYDFIFMDAAKGQYPALFPHVTSALKKGGILVTDNIFHDGDLIESRYLIRRRDRTIHKRMREYVHMLTHNESLYTSILPIGDGISLSVKK